MVAELFGVMCFEIKGKRNPSCLLGLLQNLIVIKIPARIFIILATLEEEMILSSTNKIFLKGVYEVNIECPQYH